MSMNLYLHVFRYAFVHTRSVIDTNDYPSSDGGDFPSSPSENVFECAGVLTRHVVLRPDAVGSLLHNRMTTLIKEKYGSKRYVFFLFS